MNKGLKQIAKLIKKAKKIAIFTHIDPDFDALGSSLSLYYVLKELKKEVVVFSKNNFTHQEKLILDESIINHNDCNVNNFELFISTDTPTLKRLGDYSSIFSNLNNNTIVIDHHNNLDLKGKHTYINANYSSCSEIIFELLKMMKIKISSFVATILYTGLASDTNSFINSNTNSFSFIHACELAKLGADLVEVNQKLFRTKTKMEIELKKYLYTNYKIKKDIAYCYVDNQTLKQLKAEKSNCSGFSTTLISIENINYSFSIVEDEDGNCNISLRSKDGYDVRKIAESLGGGGHICASGARIQSNNIKYVVNKILKLIENNR